MEVISKIFEEIKTKLHCLFNDTYGNYFCQKFFCSLTEQERLSYLENVIILFFLFKYLLIKYLFHKISEHINDIAKNKIGTYPLQAIIDCLITPDEEIITMNSLKKEAVKLSFVRI